MKIKFKIALTFLLLFNLYSYAQLGYIDSSFGTYGALRYDALDTNKKESYWDMDISNSGKILLYGVVYPDTSFYSTIELLEYNSNGSANVNFGTNGKASFNPSDNNIIQSASYLPNGSILCIGESEDANGIHNYFTLLLNSDGTINTNYGNNGYFTIPRSSIIGNSFSFNVCTDVSDDGSALICIGKHFDSIAVLKVTNSGILDTNFGSNGITVIPTYETNTIFDAKSQPDGKILIAGSIDNSLTSNNDFMLLRLNSDGTVDNTFGNSGMSTSTFQGREFNFLTSINLLASGKIIVTACADNSNNLPACIGAMRYNPDGTIDSSYATNGQFIYPVANWIDPSTGYSDLDELGNLYLCASEEDNYTPVLSLNCRIDSNGNLDTSYGIMGFGEGLAISTQEPLYLDRMMAQSSSRMIASGYLYNDTINATGEIILIAYNTTATTGLKNLDNPNTRFTIFPNPSSQEIYIESKDARSRMVRVSIYSLTGKLLKEINEYEVGQNEAIDLSSLAPGNYVISIDDENNKSSFIISKDK